MSKELIKHIDVLNTERNRLKDCETYEFGYNSKLLEALEEILTYISELETSLEEQSKECLRMQTQYKNNL